MSLGVLYCRQGGVSNNFWCFSELQNTFQMPCSSCMVMLVALNCTTESASAVTPWKVLKLLGCSMLSLSSFPWVDTACIAFYACCPRLLWIHSFCAIWYMCIPDCLSMAQLLRIIVVGIIYHFTEIFTVRHKFVHLLTIFLLLRFGCFFLALLTCSFQYRHVSLKQETLFVTCSNAPFSFKIVVHK